jgi:hypothetical protein
MSPSARTVRGDIVTSATRHGGSYRVSACRGTWTPRLPWWKPRHLGNRGSSKHSARPSSLQQTMALLQLTREPMQSSPRVVGAGLTVVQPQCIDNLSKALSCDDGGGMTISSGPPKGTWAVGAKFGPRVPNVAAPCPATANDQQTIAAKRGSPANV